MAKLGSVKRPAIVRVQTQEGAEEIVSVCEQRGWKVIVGIEPDQPEDISDLERLLNPSARPRSGAKPQTKVGRNAPCPCGSGKKYKRCCLSRDFREEMAQPVSSSPRFEYEAGAYGGSGKYAPSIACLKQVAGSREQVYHFVLAKLGRIHEEEDAASSEAADDLNRAFQRKAETGSDIEVAKSLRSIGYVSLEGFEIADA